MLNEYRHTNNLPIKSNHFIRHSSVKTCPPQQQHQKQQQQHRSSFPSPTKVSRANTMKAIPEQDYNRPRQMIVFNKKRHHNSKRINNTQDDDMPLALLAYKKGYKAIYPSSTTNNRQGERMHSYVSTSSSNSSTPSIVKPVIRQYASPPVKQIASPIKQSASPIKPSASPIKQSASPKQQRNTKKENQNKRKKPHRSDTMSPLQQPVEINNEAKIITTTTASTTTTKSKKWFSSLLKLLD